MALRGTKVPMVLRQPQTHLYEFVHNSPVTIYDVLGLDYRYRQEGLHTVVEIRFDDGTTAYFDWTPDPEIYRFCGREGFTSCLINSVFGRWIRGVWRARSWSFGLPLPWHDTTPSQDGALVIRFVELMNEVEGPRYYNMYRNNSYRAPRKVVDQVLNGTSEGGPCDVLVFPVKCQGLPDGGCCSDPCDDRRGGEE